MKLLNIDNQVPDFVTMSQMKPGQVGEIVSGEPFGGTIVAKVGNSDVAVVVSLDGGPEFWYAQVHRNTLKVKLFKPGTILKFEVQNV
jgi:hypothetical protein